MIQLAGSWRPIKAADVRAVSTCDETVHTQHPRTMLSGIPVRASIANRRDIESGDVAVPTNTS